MDIHEIIAAVEPGLPEGYVVQGITTRGGADETITVTIAPETFEAPVADPENPPEVPKEIVEFERQPSPDPEVSQPADVGEVERPPTYADETAVGEAVVDSNADVVSDVSMFVFQPPVEEPTDASTPEDVVVEDEPAQADEGPE